ncbi:glucosamine-6-phosphate deaminase [Olivibacter ginsenosidimutans]|uniref:Glucosamine-6-phosphate deaminase n=1 Tax=Olivibacter ginsenosidimutans TaxID=1176537 RepID=A0ABP9AVC6_9SPHI
MVSKRIQLDQLIVECFDTREALGAAAGKEVLHRLSILLAEKEEVNMIFAAAPSQVELLTALVKAKQLDWNRVNAFHMDEYVGLDKVAPQGFGNFLDRHLFAHLPFKRVFYLTPFGKSAASACEAYANALQAYPTDIVCMGIGENGHIAFNDPHVADFDDPELVKIVHLDEACRQQQVNDKCFHTLNEVPSMALTLTVPALMRARYAFCTVPAASKALAVYRTLAEPIREECPASILRRHPKAKLFVDRDSFTQYANRISNTETR